MPYTLDLSYYQDLIRPLVCQLQDCHGDDELIEERSQLILWQVILYYPQVLSCEERLVSYVEERILEHLAIG